MNNTRSLPTKRMSRDIFFSCDIEADGPIPGPYSMVSIGLVAYAVTNSDGTVTELDILSGSNRFYVELKPISEDWVPEALAISGLSRDYLLETGSDPIEGMTHLVEWVEDLAKEHNAAPVFAALPLGFDWMFAYWYMMNFAKRSPFSHGRHWDARSAFMGVSNYSARDAGKRNMRTFLKSKSNHPHTHNALDDAVEASELFLDILKASRP